MQISIIIPTFNAAVSLPRCFDVLAEGSIKGLVREVIIADGGSQDQSRQIAEAVGAIVLTGAKGRGAQLLEGARSARSEWLMFVHADTVLGTGWIDQVGDFIRADPNKVGVFRLKFDDQGLAPKIVAAGAMIRTRLFGSPYGDQGLVISHKLYDEIGGYKDMVLFEDVDIIRRIRKKIGHGSIHMFEAQAITSADRYRSEGYTVRVMRNFICVMMFQFGRTPEEIMAFYQGKRKPNKTDRASLSRKITGP